MTFDEWKEKEGINLFKNGVWLSTQRFHVCCWTLWGMQKEDKIRKKNDPSGVYGKREQETGLSRPLGRRWRTGLPKGWGQWQWKEEIPTLDPQTESELCHCHPRLGLTASPEESLLKCNVFIFFSLKETVPQSAASSRLSKMDVKKTPSMVVSIASSLPNQGCVPSFCAITDFLTAESCNEDMWNNFTFLKLHFCVTEQTMSMFWQ